MIFNYEKNHESPSCFYTFSLSINFSSVCNALKFYEYARSVLLKLYLYALMSFYSKTSTEADILKHDLKPSVVQNPSDGSPLPQKLYTNRKLVYHYIINTQWWGGFDVYT